MNPDKHNNNDNNSNQHTADKKISSLSHIPKISIALLLIAILGLMIYFRENISSLLSFGTEQNQPQAVRRFDLPPGTPDYTGQDPEKANVSPKETAVYTKEQLNKIYADLKTYGKAVKQQPGFFFGWMQVGFLKKIVGDYKGARDAWEYASIIRPKNSVSFANLGELYWRYLPDYPKAEKNFLQSIQNKPDDTSTYISLSEFYFYSYTQKADLADDVLLEGLEKNPADVNLMKALAVLYERREDYNKAILWWNKVLAKEPKNKEIKDHINELKSKK